MRSKEAQLRGFTDAWAVVDTPDFDINLGGPKRDSCFGDCHCGLNPGPE